MIKTKNAGVEFGGCVLELLDDLMITIKSAHNCITKYEDEEFANKNIAEVIKIALASDDEKFEECRKAYLDEMKKELCEHCEDFDDCQEENPFIKGLIDFLDGITGKAEEEPDEDDEPEIECEMTVIKVKSPEELLEELNKISGKSQKKDGEE